MAKPSTQRRVAQFPFVAAAEVIPQPLTFCVPPKGMDTQLRLNQMSREVSRLVQNLRIRDQHYVTRDGTDTLGTVSTTQLIYATSVKLSTGRIWYIRWRTDGVDVLVGGTWTPVLGDAFTAPNTSQVSVTGWNDTLVFTIGIDQLFELSFVLNIPAVTRIVDSPENVGHVTTFAGRIICSIRDSSNIIWCVKNDNTDWTGQGSGNEALLSAPGGSVDQQTAIAPVTDEYAYCVRTNSVWQMTLTGDPDAPFRFTLLYQGVGSEYPGTVKSLNRAVAFVSRDDVVMVSPEGKKNIGESIRERVRVDKQYLRDASADYDPRDNEYILSIPDANSLNAHKVYRYKVEAGWTQDVYPFPVKSVSFVRYSGGLTINQLTGTINELAGATNDLGQSDRTVGLLFAMSGSSRFVARSSNAFSNDIERDVNSAGVRVPGGWRLETAYVMPQSTLRKVQIVTVEIEYEAETACDLTFEYSEDGGVSWIQYAARTAAMSPKPRVLRVRQTVERDTIQIAVNCAATPTFRLIALHIHASTGGSIEDAR